jgi:hypothetical protein
MVVVLRRGRSRLIMSSLQIVLRMSCPFKKIETFVMRQNSAVSPDLVPTLQSMKGEKRGAHNTANRRQRRSDN